MTGAEALKRACLEVPQVGRKPPPKKPNASREDAIVDAAFKLLEAPIKGWIRARVRKGSSVLESVASLSSLLEAGQSIASAAGGIAHAVRAVSAVTKGKK